MRQYGYDAANRLITVTEGTSITLYAYDGWGNLVRETVNGVVTDFVLDENSGLPRILGAISGGNTQLYAYSVEGFAAQKTLGGSVEYPLLDALGSVRRLTNSSGGVILSRSYDAWGNLRASNGTGSTRLGYTGELQDPLSGLVYLRARHYNPIVGRFLQRDSFAGFQTRPQSLNRYSYTENNPVNYSDPSGHYVDTILDIGFISYDIYRIIHDNILNDCGNLKSNLIALGLDVGSALLPVVVGAGAAYRAGRFANKARELWNDATTTA